jgi:hypothetical protein
VNDAKPRCPLSELRFSRFKFVEGDFQSLSVSLETRDAIVLLANAHIEAMLKDAPLVFCDEAVNYISNWEYDDNGIKRTHRAKLVCIEEIGGEG